MNYPRVLLIIGLLIILIPFLGIPLLWKHLVTVLLGMFVFSFTILYRSSIKVAKHAVSARQRTPVQRSPRIRKAVGVPARRLSQVLQEEAPEAPVITSKSLIEDHDQA